jgi:hypothetical protein
MSLTLEQQQALEALMAWVPRKATAPAPAPDWLETWLGLSPETVNTWLGELLADKAKLEARLLTWAERNPLEATFEFLAAAALAFYAAEKDANPKVRTLLDAFYYISTCASVGYADIFAVTQAGRAVASLVMVIGPPLTSRALNRASASEPGG